MLYDVLIIDDVFELQEGETEGLSEEGAKDDVADVADVSRFVLQLLKNNIRVACSSGEDDDLERFANVELSTIKYIFLDLHLQGIGPSASIRTINSKLINIMSRIHSLIKSDSVSCLINSRYQEEGQGYGPEGVEDLRDKLKKKFSDKYTLEETRRKNFPSKSQKDKISKSILKVHVRTAIIDVALRVEKIFDEKLKIKENLRDVITFDNKYLKYKKAFNVDKETKARIELLKHIRNKLAHSDIDSLESISNQYRKTFWKIFSNQEVSENPSAIQFEDLKSLDAYLQSTEDLCKKIESIGLQPEQ